MFLVIGIFVSSSSMAFAFEWAILYGGTSYDRAYSIQQTADSGYIVAGYTESFGTGSGDFWVLKLNSNGTVAWQKTYGGTDDDRANSIQQTADGGYIVAGYTYSFSIDRKDFWVIKLNSDGTVAWQKTYGGSDDDRAYSIQQTSDGGYIVAGAKYLGNGLYDFWVIKLNSDGTVAWQKTYGGSDDDVAHSIQQTADGGYIVAGITASFDVGSGDFWIIKLNSDGTVAWQKTYGGTGQEWAYSIQQTADGGYIVAGVTASFSAGLRDFWVLKLNSEGTVDWQKAYGGIGDEYAYSIQQTADSGYIVAGFTTSFGAGLYDFWVLKLNSEGTVDWQKAYGGYDDDVAHSIQQTADGSYIVAGYAESFGAGSGDFWVLRLDTNGEISECNAMGTSSATVNNTTATIINTPVSGTNTIASLQTSTATPLNTNATVEEVCYYEHYLFISVSPVSHDFGTINVGSSTAPQTFTIYNTGSADLHISGIALSDATNYTLDVNGGINPCGSKTPTITHDGSCTVIVTFNPLSIVQKDASFTINSDDPVTPTINIQLTGIGVLAPIILLAPNSSVIIPSGSIYTIQWNALQEAVKYDLEYSVNKGASWNPIVSNITVSSYNWQVPTPSNNIKGCLIKVIGYNSSDIQIAEGISDKTFMIQVVKVTSPNGKEVLKSGITWTVTWKTNETIRPISKVKLFYTTNGGNIWTLIKAFKTNPDRYNWQVPYASSSSCKVKVVLQDSRGVNIGKDVSDRFFTIQP